MSLRTTEEMAVAILENAQALLAETRRRPQSGTPPTPSESRAAAASWWAD
jgi:hypothetical protein